MSESILTREQLRALRDSVNSFVKAKGAGINWKSQFLKLSDSCDTLDAVMSRAGVAGIELIAGKIKKLEATDEK